MQTADRAYISAIGMMGRRHVKGLVRAGYDVFSIDPNPVAFDIARRELELAGLDSRKLNKIEQPEGWFSVAIFSETTPHRLENFKRFLDSACARRILLEKPLSADPLDYAQYLEIAKLHKVEAISQVNFIRRTWPHVQRLAELCSQEKKHFIMTLNGGALGLGCMGIHYLNTFLYLSSDELPVVRWVNLSNDMVKSGRGEQFEDFGGDFVVESPCSCLLASLSAESSANVLMSVRGEHFVAQVDYNEMYWKIARRKVESDAPLYRYGADYEVVEQGHLEIPSMDAVTESWSLGQIDLPSIEQALITHHLLDEILRAGGAKPPYRFT